VARYLLGEALERHPVEGVVDEAEQGHPGGFTRSLRCCRTILGLATRPCWTEPTQTHSRQNAVAERHRFSDADHPPLPRPKSDSATRNGDRVGRTAICDSPPAFTHLLRPLTWRNSPSNLRYIRSLMSARGAEYDFCSGHAMSASEPVLPTEGRLRQYRRATIPERLASWSVSVSRNSPLASPRTRI
jgi:hypothetical protein